LIDPSAWVDDRIAGAPESLREAVQREVDGMQVAMGVADALMAAAERLLVPSAVPSAASPAVSASALLTADALVTRACQWVAEHEPERLGAPR